MLKQAIVASTATLALFGQAAAATTTVDQQAQTITTNLLANDTTIQLMFKVLDCKYGTLTTLRSGANGGVSVIDLLDTSSQFQVKRVETARKTCLAHKLTPEF